MSVRVLAEDNLITNTGNWLSDPQNWSGPDGIPVRVFQHLEYTGIVMLVSVVIAVPLGLFIGHTRKGQGLVLTLASVLKALPTLGLATLFVLLAGLGLTPFVWALVILALPPILSATYAGIANVDSASVDAARAQGMTERQVLFGVELPAALPVMLGGFRSAVLQTVATATIVAVISLGGLGRYIFDGVASSDFPEVLGGGVIVALLAIILDLLLLLAGRFVIPRGLRAKRQ